MFKRRDDKQDAIHHTNIKRGITSNFARMLKVLQQKHLQTDVGEFIYSNDSSNNLCNSLEAVFLHGLKDSVAQKLTAYVGLTAAPEQLATLNFWSVAVKFTHSDVVTQLQKLSQINTDIGLCRAWVRLALNDGLMESYLHSMIVDVKTLKYFYHSYSYLRDPEQPGILKNYLTGLMSLDFQLSFNSSVLNSWNNSTLQLVGVLDAHRAPSPSVSQTVEQPAETSKEKDGPAASGKKVTDEPIVAPKNPPSTLVKEDTAMFSSIKDVEELKRAVTNLGQTTAQFSTSLSEGSSSSHVSCPDPHFGITVEAQASSSRARDDSVVTPIVSPALFPRPGPEKDNLWEKYGMFSFGDDEEKRESWNGKDKDVVQSLGNKSERSLKSPVVVEEVNPLDMATSPTRPRSRRVTDEDLKHLSPRSFSPTLTAQKAPLITYDETIQDDNGIVYTPSPSPQGDSYLQEDAWRKRHKSPQRECATTGDHTRSSHSLHLKGDQRVPSPGPGDGKQNRNRTYEEICATLPPLKLDAMEQDAILKKVLKELDKQADKEREKKENKTSAGADKNSMESKQSEQAGQKATAISAASTDASKSANGIKSSLLGKPESTQKHSQSPTPASTSTSKAVRSRTSSPASKSRSQSRTSSPAPQIGDGQPMSDQIEEHQPLKHSGAKHKLQTRDAPGHKHKKHGDKEKEKSHDHTSPVHETSTGAVSNAIDDQFEEKSPYDRAVEQDKENDGGTESPGVFGNSLSIMSGWSSEIEAKTMRGMSSAEKNRGESFESMLRSYAPVSADSHQAVTLNQVIETLPVDTDDESDERPSVTARRSHADLAQRQDSILEDFEVLKSPSGSFCGQVEANSSRMIFLFRVPREHGLSHQNFTCRGCTRPIGIIYGPPRLCEFDGGLYCFECHENNESYIPSSIVFDWDFKKKKVCRENYRFLQELEDQALYDVEELNPKLYSHVSELQDLKILRQQLCYLKSYLFTCSQKVAESLRQRVWPREHLYERRDLYSVTDFLQVQSGTLYRLIKDLVKYASQHVYECILCSQKGFVCEICRNSRVIYPFEVDTTIRCKTCKAVYHKTCMTESLPCPKCERWGNRISNKSNILGDHPEDYGMSPPL